MTEFNGVTRASQAYQEMLRIKELSAFSISGAVKRRKLNQHAVLYTFADKSCLQIETTSGRAIAWAGAYGKRLWSPIRVNKSS